jgi:hypothetical protein
LHDRYFIPNTGAVRALGTSLGGVGKNVSILTTLGGEASTLLRGLHERKWAEGEPVLPPVADPVSSKEPPAKKVAGRTKTAKKATARRATS